jgi:hypothetical protein
MITEVLASQANGMTAFAVHPRELTAPLRKPTQGARLAQSLTARV